MPNHVYPFGFSGDQECLISMGPIAVSKPYPTAYPVYFGTEIQSTVSKRLSFKLAKLAEKLK